MEQPVEVMEIDTDFQAERAMDTTHSAAGEGDGIPLTTTTKRARLALDAVIPDSEEDEEDMLPEPKRPRRSLRLRR
jgi:hypothetical protein